MKSSENKTSAESRPRPYYDYLSYFGKEKRFHLWFAEKRTQFISKVFPSFVRVGVAPDTISYVGIALLAGVVLYFVRRPMVAVIFLAAHVICDGLDGAFARHSNKDSQSGAFTDLVCDQLGMVVVSLLAIFHHMVYPVLGAVYISLYLIVVVFGVIINAMGLGTRITITSKYFLYIVYAVWAGWNINLFPLLMTFFSGIMAIEVLIGYLRLKRGIRRKFDTQVRFAEGDAYSGRLNYALNVAVPITTFLVIIVIGNWIPIKSMLDQPKIKANWIAGPKITTDSETIVGLGGHEEDLYILTSDGDGSANIKKYSKDAFSESATFSVPEYISPVFTTFPVDGNTLLIADSTTRLLLGFDLKASFATRRAVIVLTLPLEYLRITAMAKGTVDNRTAWLTANYLYTRKTYVVDASRAIKKGKLLNAIIGSYVNAGFPSGMTVKDNIVFEFNKSPMQALIYCAPLEQLISGMKLIDSKVSFLPPVPDAFGPLNQGENLVMVTPSGQIYQMNSQSIMSSFNR